MEKPHHFIPLRYFSLPNPIGTSTYSFKYFCVNIKGTFSDGKILTFTTHVSTHQTIKLTLGFGSPLNFTTTNNMACAIAEGLVIPYQEVRTSVNTNCKTMPLIYYNAYTDIVWDLKTPAPGEVFYYNFYIRSVTEVSQSMVTTVRDKLKATKRVINAEVPLWSAFNMYISITNQTIDN